VIPQKSASFLVVFSLVISLTFVLQPAPHAMVGQSARAALRSDQAWLAQTSQGGLSHRSTVTSATHPRPVVDGPLKSRPSSPSVNQVFFTIPAYVSGGLNANAVTLGDVNGDGKLDLVVANGYADNTETNGAVSVLLGVGDGTFQSAVNYGSGGIDAVSVTTGDVNGDGKLDLIVTNQCVDVNCANGSVAVLLGNGDGTFQPAVSYSSGGVYSEAVVVADVNRDGVPDVLVANQCIDNSCASGEVSVLLGNGDGTFQPAVSYGSGGKTTNSLAVGDANGDGNPDLMVVNSCASSNDCTQGTVAVLLGNGDGTFQPAVSYGSGGEAADSVVIADVNSDGKLDLMVANQCASSSNCTSGTVAVLIGNGDGTFQPASGYGSGGPTAYSVAVGDINGDGKTDLIVANQCASTGNCANTVGVLLGNGDGTFQSALNYGAGGSQASSVAIGDVNGDGKADLVVANQCASSSSCAAGSVGVLLGNGNATFQARVSYQTGGSQANSTAVADLNGDGNPDLIVANQCADFNCATGSVSVLLGNGDATFHAPVSYQTGGWQADSVAVGDVNGDGIPDLIVANQCVSSGSCTNGTVAVLAGNGDGTFQAAVGYGSGGVQAQWVAVADVNHDGRLDLVVANQCIDANCATGSVGVLLGNGDGTFQAAISYGSGGPQASSLAIGDVNGDGNTDIVVANQCAGSGNCTNASVAVLLGNGDGTFQAAVGYGPGGAGSAYSVTIGDVNGDGKLDLVVANECHDETCTTGAISILAGNGDGTFQPAVSTSTLQLFLGQAQSLALADFDGDGKLDVASGGGNFLLLGNGDETFQPPTTLDVASPGVVAGDFNQDGKTDLAVVGGGTITVLRNVAANFRYATSTAVTSSSNPAGVGQSITLTVTVMHVFDAGAITGGVVFYDGANALSNASIASGQATISTSSLLVGTHSITAAYAGDSNYLASNSAVLVETVNSRTTATVVTSAPNPSTFGQTVTFNAAVTTLGGSAPTGTMTFNDGANVLGTASLSNGQAVLSYSSLGAGHHSIVANYSGDSTYQASASSTLTQSVNVASTTLVLSTSVNPSSYNQGVTFMVSLTPQMGGSATGTVTFLDGANPIGTSTVAGNSATITVNTLAIGTHPITAAYSGDSNFTAANSASLPQIVNKAGTTAVVTSSLNPAFVTQGVTYTATVTSQYMGALSGSVNFKSGTVSLGTGTLVNGQASITTSSSTPGSLSITADYIGDANNIGSTSPALTQVVNKITTSANVTSSLNPSLVGQSVTFTVTLTSSYGVVPGGETVTFLDGSTPLATGTLSGGMAILNTSTLAAGVHNITVTYAGDSNFTGTAPVMTQVVNKNPSSATITSNLNPSTFGQALTLTASVATSGSPTGTVTFMSGTTTLGTVALAGNIARLSTSTLAAGAHPINAVYSGDAAFNNSTSPALNEVVNKAPPVEILQTLQNPSAFGQAVTFKAMVSSAAGVPTGSVTFMNGTTKLATVTVSGGVATYVIPNLRLGTNTITANYGGAANFAIGSASVTQVVSTALPQCCCSPPNNQLSSRKPERSPEVE
jgi:hypothetical protein